MENCCQSIVKYLIFIFNFVIAVAGLTLVGLSAYVYTQSGDNTLIALVVFGIVIFIISFFGCYGSLSENKCMIYAYATVLFVISLIEIFIAVSIYDYIPGLPQSMKADMDNYGINGTITAGVDAMQKMFTCCGVINYEDWNTNSTVPGSHLNDYKDWNTNSTAPNWNINSTALDWYPSSTASGSVWNVPDSCCDTPPCNANNVYPEGCFEKLATMATISATVTIGIALLQMIISICSCWIGHSSR